MQVDSNAANVTVMVPAPAVTNESPEAVNMALIGGIVGGVVGLLLIIGLIACCIVTRNRRKTQVMRSHAAQSNNYGRMPTVAPHDRRYDVVATGPLGNDYSELAITPPPNYDAWAETTYGNGQLEPNRNYYDDFTHIQ